MSVENDGSTEQYGAGDGLSGGDQPAVAGAPVTVRRHAGLAALVGAGASAVAIAYLWRASQTMLPLDWALCGVMATIAVVYLAALVDSRTPLVVADDLGVRIRLGDEWRGLPWEAIGQVVVHPRRSLFRDGRLVFQPVSLARALEGLDRKARRQAALNQKLYGAALAVPLGVTTRLSTGGEHDVVAALDALALGRTTVLDTAAGRAEITDPDTHTDSDTADAGVDAPVEAVDEAPGTDAGHDPQPTGATRTYAPEHAWQGSALQPTAGPTLPLQPLDHPAVDGEAGEQASAGPEDLPAAPAAASRPALHGILGGLGMIVSRVAKGRSHDVDGAGPAAAEPELPAAAHAPAGASPLRQTRSASRAQVTRDTPATLGNTALAPVAEVDALPEARELRRPGSVDLVFEPAGPDARVRPISQLGEPVAPLVIDAFVTEPAYDPVIGPELAAARTRLGLSVDELADRTRIRPHVIESIEVDDFAPCGGDFYARGHLRTMARVLGKDVEPLLVQFEERYATAPINARRVFEAELATGMTGSMRSTLGGPNWGLMIGVVLSLVVVWGVVRLFAGEPAEIMQNPPPLTSSAPAAGDAYTEVGAPQPVTQPLAVTLVAAHADTEVVVKDGTGATVFSGELVLGEKRRFSVSPPVRIQAADAGALEAVVDGRDRGVLGVLGQAGARSFR